jgi:hypothetical protein
VTVVAAGETTVKVTVTQYGRTDSYTAKITVAKKAEENPANPGTVIDPGIAGVVDDNAAAGDNTVADGSGDATEEIPTVTVTAVKKGTVLTDKTSKAKYKVTSAASAKTHTVTYVGTTSSSKKSITIPATVKIGGVTYKVTAIAANAFKKNTKITSVTIGKNIKTIGKNAFYGCTKLKSITFKSGSALEKIAAGAFAKCTSLKKVSIPASVKSIGSKAFYGCTKLSKVTFAKNSKLSTVKKNAFSKCTSLKKLTLPKKAKSVK